MLVLQFSLVTMEWQDLFSISTMEKKLIEAVRGRYLLYLYDTSRADYMKIKFKLQIWNQVVKNIVFFFINAFRNLFMKLCFDYLVFEIWFWTIYIVVIAHCVYTMSQTRTVKIELLPQLSLSLCIDPSPLRINILRCAYTWDNKRI